MTREAPATYECPSCRARLMRKRASVDWLNKPITRENWKQALVPLGAIFLYMASVAAFLFLLVAEVGKYIPRHL